MNIAIKLKYGELMALVRVLEDLLPPGEAVIKTRQEAIVWIIMMNFYIRLKRQCAIVEIRTYRFSFGPETALSFVTYFSYTKYFTVSYSGMVINNLISQFDKQTTTYHSC